MIMQYTKEISKYDIVLGMKTCSILSCSNKLVARKLCGKHYQRWQSGKAVLNESSPYDPRPAILKGKTALIPLNVDAKDGYAVVDLENAYLDAYKWHTAPNGYPMAYVDGVNTTMHWLIMGKKPGMFCDHINGNRLDNRKNNLRFVTPLQNSWNSQKSKRNSTGYKGVKWNKLNNNWNAKIYHAGKHYHLGVFSTAEEAALAYNKAATEFRGEFAVLNKIPGQ